MTVGPRLLATNYWLLATLLATLLLRHRGEPSKRISIKRLCLPGVSVPLAVLVSDYLHREDDAVAAELIRSSNAIVEFSTGSHSKLYRYRQPIIPKQFELILTWI